MSTYDGTYATVPLRNDEIHLGIVQSRMRTIDPDNPEQGKRENLDHMLQLIDQAHGWDKKDLLCFHEFPLGGFSFDWSREQVLRIAVDVPGEETEAIGQKAKQHNCYIEFGCYARDADWPGHFFNMGVIIGPDGDVVLKRWKTRNLSGFGFSTTIYDVLDAYIERYGHEALFPIARTDIGNIGIIPEVLEPELGRAYAIKGAEIMIRYMTIGGGTWSVKPLGFAGNNGVPTFRLDLQAMCMAGHYYGVFVNDAVSTENEAFNLGAGGSAIIDPNGQVLMEALSVNETVVSCRLPLATYRKRHQPPVLPTAIYEQLYADYVPKFPPNAFKDYLPESMADGARHYGQIKQWKA